jgi:hypothetical protein
VWDWREGHADAVECLISGLAAAHPELYARRDGVRARRNGHASDASLANADVRCRRRRNGCDHAGGNPDPTSQEMKQLPELPPGRLLLNGEE